MKRKEPYPHLTDAELEEVIADWTDGRTPSSHLTTLEILRGMVNRLADRMGMSRDKAA